MTLLWQSSCVWHSHMAIAVSCSSPGRAVLLGADTVTLSEQTLCLLRKVGNEVVATKPRTVVTSCPLKDGAFLSGNCPSYISEVIMHPLRGLPEMCSIYILGNYGP